MRKLLILLLLVVLAVGAWVGIRGYLAYQNAEAATDRLPTLQEQIQSFQIDEARRTLSLMQDDTADARRLTSDPVWNAVAAFPFGGQNLEAFSTAATVADGLACDGLPGMVDAAEGLAQFQAGLEGGELDGEGLRAAADGVDQLDATLRESREALDAIDRSYLLPQVERALAELEASLDVAEQVRSGVAENLDTSTP